MNKFIALFALTALVASAAADSFTYTAKITCTSGGGNVAMDMSGKQNDFETYINAQLGSVGTFTYSIATYTGLDGTTTANGQLVATLTKEGTTKDATWVAFNANNDATEKMATAVGCPSNFAGAYNAASSSSTTTTTTSSATAVKAVAAVFAAVVAIFAM